MKIIAGVLKPEFSVAECGEPRQSGVDRPCGKPTGRQSPVIRDVAMGVLLLTLLGVAGCSSSQAADTAEATTDDAASGAIGQAASDGEELSTMAYCAQAAVAICDRAYSCGAQTGKLRAKLGYGDRAECREELSQQFERLCRPGAVSIQKGRATYDQSTAKACLSTLETSSCSAISEGLDGFGRGIFEPGACEDFIEPHQALGDACLSGNECEGTGVYCDGYAFTGNSADLGEDWTTLGECSVLRQEGDSCSPGMESDCADGLFCNSGGACTHIPTTGESCAAPWFVCADGLSCNEGICGAEAESQDLL